MIRLKQLGMKYPDGTVAMADIDLDIPKGQFCIVLGPSGAGKSTLLRCLNGLVTPTSGTIEIEDQPIRGQRAVRAMQHRVAMIHQSFNLSPRLKVLTNVLTGLLNRTPTWRALLGLFSLQQRRRACHLLENVGLREEQIYRRASGLSGGQQQRVGIARAFVGDPEIVLADEPVASLDPRISADILTLLRNASRARGTTVLCSLHQVELARRFGDRIVAMKAGRLVFDGPPEALSDAALEAIYGQTELSLDRDDNGSTRPEPPNAGPAEPGAAGASTVDPIRGAVA